MDGIDLFDTFCTTHKLQLESYGVPQLFWKILFKKIQNQIYDAGLAFQLMQVEYENGERHVTEPIWKLIVSAEKGISVDDSNNIYLIDHAWTYDVSSAQQNLIQVPGLLNRMCVLMGINTEADEQEKIENVLNEMWRYNQSYSLNYGNIEDRMPVWYIMDEVGSAINHSDEPNFRAVPFLYMLDGVIYTLLFPIKDSVAGDEVTRDFAEGQTKCPEKRCALLLPWIHSTFKDENFDQSEPDADYFLTGHIPESLPKNLDTIRIDTSRKLKVFSEYSYVNDYLTDPAFEVTDNREEADILWLVSHYKTYEELNVSLPHVFINQFPYENVLTTKDLLSIICRRKATDKLYDPDTLETYPTWLPTTYNLSTELVQFVAYFTRRAEKNLDNHWICKPWNLARGLDTHITNNLYHILRLPFTGPKIAQKYIACPVLYNRPDINQVKFDIRYVVLLKSVKPLRVYAYANFFLRFANQSFALNNFNTYEQHFTVMNYTEENSLFHMKCADFIIEWENQYPDYSWRTYVEPKILSVLRQVFEAAVAQPPPKGIAESPQSRAVYAADLMLEWRDNEMQPKLLEINFTPDCKRACEYYPDFYNDIFKCLFLDIDNPEVFHKLDSVE
ncbi:tubulin--tyrosine ligase-like protein 12 [Pogonomyrmex barbatus]|uniref:Tubulin--tyrosine ligase-like protein 12 n=1 Tax=Pogonomyrmex barbatus TaxID=144034 RepID=A0A6I9WM89_9HYME|nr:tubulin--tyrosine ligase-like protein 12 [Pogonomyrmex barbatus]